MKSVVRVARTSILVLAALAASKTQGQAYLSLPPAMQNEPSSRPNGCHGLTPEAVALAALGYNSEQEAY